MDYHNIYKKAESFVKDLFDQWDRHENLQCDLRGFILNYGIRHIHQGNRSGITIVSSIIIPIQPTYNRRGQSCITANIVLPSGWRAC